MGLAFCLSFNSIGVFAFSSSRRRVRLALLRKTLEKRRKKVPHVVMALVNSLPFNILVLF